MGHFKWLFNAIRAAHFYLQHKSLIIQRVGLMNFVEGEDMQKIP